MACRSAFRYSKHRAYHFRQRENRLSNQSKYAMILNSTDIQKYVPMQTSSFSFDKYAGFENRALHKHFPRLLGETLTDALDLYGTNPDPDSSGSGSGVAAEEMELLAAKVIPVLANLAVLESVPFFDVVLTSSGFGVVRNNNIAPASKERVQAFAEACLAAANDFADILLAFMEKNQADFTAWNKSSLLTGSLVASTTQFNSLTRLFLKRHQFIDVKMHIATLENNDLAAIISPQFLAELQAGSNTTVKPLFQTALAFLALAKYTRLTAPDGNQGVAEAWKHKGKSYLDKAMAMLNASPSTYPTYQTYGYSAPYDNNSEDNQVPGFFVAGA